MTSSLRQRHAVTATALAVVLFAAACGSDSAENSDEPGGAVAQPTEGSVAQPTEGSSEPLQVVASTDVYGSIASVVGGDLVEVTSIIEDSSADPLEYESTPADAAAVTEAQLVIYNGNGYDEFMPQLVDAAGEVEAVLDASEISGLAPEAEAAGEEFNEHVWYDLDTVQTLATTIAAELGQALPEDAETFESNADDFNTEVGMLQEQLEEIATSSEGARVAVTEPLANYLLEDAGLENVAPEAFQEAIEEGEDPAAAVLQEMLSLFGDDPVQVLILNTQTQSAVTDQVVQAAEAADVPIVQMSETLTSPDYVEWMGGQIEALAAALDG